MTAADLLDDLGQRGGEVGARLLAFVVLVMLCVVIGRLLRPFVRWRLSRRGRPSYTRVFGALYSACVAVGAVLLAATLAFPSVHMVDVLGGLGIISVAVGFAFKEVLENLLAGVLLLLRDPFKSGDEISVGSFDGVVEGITVRETLLRTHAGQRVLLPNAYVYTSPLEVLTHYPDSRFTFTVTVDLDAPLERVSALAAAALSEVPDVRAFPAPEALVTAIGVGEVTLECRAWTTGTRRGTAFARDRAIKAVLRALVNAGVPLASGDTLLREVGRSTYTCADPASGPAGQQ